LAVEGGGQDALVEAVGLGLGPPTIDEVLGGGLGVLGGSGGVGGDLGGPPAALAVEGEVLDDLAAASGERLDGRRGDVGDVGDAVVDRSPSDTEAAGQLPAQLGLVGAPASASGCASARR